MDISRDMHPTRIAQLARARVGDSKQSVPDQAATIDFLLQAVEALCYRLDRVETTANAARGASRRHGIY